MQLISLQQRKKQPKPPCPSSGPSHGPDDDPPPKGGLAIHLRDVRFDPPVITDALARWAA